jgi:protein ImuB
VGVRAAAEWERLAPLLDVLGNRLGFARLQRPGPRESHLPERAVEAHPVWSTPRPGPWPAAARPLRLLARPEPVEAETSREDAPPREFRRAGRLHRVARAEGPERIAAEWWRAAAPAALDGPERDYWRIEDEAGRRFWLFREAAASAAPRWFLHGLFA